MSAKIHETCKAFIAGVDHAASIDQLAEGFKAAGLFTPERIAELAEIGLRTCLRRAVNRDRRPDGVPRLTAVAKRRPADDRQLSLYLPHDELDVGDFVQLWRKARGRRRRAELVEHALEREFAKRFPDQPSLRQLALTWGKSDDGDGKNKRGDEGAA